MKRYFDLILDGKIEEAKSYMKKSVPQKLYKFVSLSDENECKAANNCKFETLANNQFYFSSFGQLNDPYEFQCWPIGEAMMNKGYPDEMIRQFQDRFDMSKHCVVACLSSNDENNLPMWAYYTNNYAGYCVEYSVIQPDLIHKVVYDDERMCGDPLYIGLLIAMVENKKDQIDILARIISEASYIKHRSWSWENEFRIVKTTNDVSKGQNIPLASIGLKVNKVVAGINCHQNHIDRIKSICYENALDFRKAVFSSTSFGFAEV